MGNKLKTGIFIFLLTILFLPLLQSVFSFVTSGALGGDFTLAPDVAFTWKEWFDGTYWDKKSKYINDNTGFRPDMVRVTDQLDFSLFNKIHSGWKLVGDNACIFQDLYVFSYLGRDYDGYPYIAEKVRKMKAIQDTLAKLGKSFIFVNAPCKAFYYPENIPAEFRDTIRGITNFETYKRIGDSLGLNQVDFNTWFCSMKNQSKELLYPKGGFHWSEYGALLAADSLVKYIEKLRNIHMMHPVWTEIEHSRKARYFDNDIEVSMNLVFPLAYETYSYPVVRYEGDKTAVKPKIIYVGDSFLFQWINDGFYDNTDGNWQIWYYNQMLVNKEFAPQANHFFDNYDQANEIDKADCIVMMFTSRNLGKMGRDFVENTYNHYYPGK